MAGRTDAGVSASGQVVSAGRRPPGSTRAGCCARSTGRSGGRRGAEPPRRRAEGFDARTDARSRAYEYRVLPGPPSPLRRDRVLHLPWRWTCRRCARRPRPSSVSTTSARSRRPRPSTFLRPHRDWRATGSQRGDELVLPIEANAFLRHMVRVLVGSMLLVGRGHWDVGQVHAAARRVAAAAAGPTAPAHPADARGGPLPGLNGRPVSRVTAYARTGNVPMPRTLGGAAVNRKPSAGSPASPVMCSTIGMPAPSRIVWTGRVPLDVSSMLSESMPTSAAPCAASSSAAAAVRKGCPAQVGRRSASARPSRCARAPRAPRPPGPRTSRHRSRSRPVRRRRTPAARRRRSIATSARSSPSANRWNGVSR